MQSWHLGIALPLLACCPPVAVLLVAHEPVDVKQEILV